MIDNWTNVLSEPVPYRICITCFCSDNGDSISQWRGYGGKDIGVSIGFNINDTFFKRGIHTRLNQVIYREDQQRQMLTNFFHIYTVISDWHEEKCILDPKYLKSTTGGEPKDLLTNLYAYLIFLKNEAFLDEREVRWVYSEDPETYDTLGIDLGPKRFRISGSQLIPYITSTDIQKIVERLSNVESNEKGRKLPITEVVVGPQENAELVSRGVRDFLDALGYKSAKLRKSQVPFRPSRRG